MKTSLPDLRYETIVSWAWGQATVLPPKDRNQPVCMFTYLFVFWCCILFQTFTFWSWFRLETISTQVHWFPHIFERSQFEVWFDYTVFLYTSLCIYIHIYESILYIYIYATCLASNIYLFLWNNPMNPLVGTETKTASHNFPMTFSAVRIDCAASKTGTLGPQSFQVSEPWLLGEQGLLIFARNLNRMIKVWKFASIWDWICTRTRAYLSKSQHLNAKI